MRKSKKSVEQVVQSFQEAIAQRFPGITQERFLEERDGFHAWVRIRVPAEMRPLHDKILRASVELTEQFWDTGVWIMGLVVQEREPVHG
jgi:hypothetical protein